MTRIEKGAPGTANDDQMVIAERYVIGDPAIAASAVGQPNAVIWPDPTNPNHSTMPQRNDKRSGQILVLFTLFIGSLMGFAAIALDLAYAMVVRTQLVTALDAATLAAIRAVPQGNAVMQAASQRAFDANLPSGRLMTLNPTLSAPNVTTSAGVVSVQFTASGRANWFPGNFNVNVSSTASNACLTSPVSGIFGITGCRGHYDNRILSLQAVVSPGAPPITPQCPNWAGQRAVQSIQPLWTPPVSPTAGAIPPAA